MEEWIRKMEQTFDLLQVPRYKWVSISGVYLTGEASSWYDFHVRKIGKFSYDVFVEHLIIKFDVIRLKKHRVELFKLCRKGSLREYVSEFEKVVAQVTGFKEEAIVDCFIGGLKEGLQEVVCDYKPTTLYSAISRAKIQEAREKAKSQITAEVAIYTTKPTAYNNTFLE